MENPLEQVAKFAYVARMITTDEGKYETEIKPRLEKRLTATFSRRSSPPPPPKQVKLKVTKCYV